MTMNVGPVELQRRLQTAFGEPSVPAPGRRRKTTARAAPRFRSILRSGLLQLGAFTFVVNALLLIQPIYMLQIYDRVLASGSMETLALISLMTLGALVLLGALDAIRGIMASRIANQLEIDAGGACLEASLNGPRARLGDVQPLRDLATVRGFIASRNVLGYLDLPFAPVFIGLLAFIHPHLFWLTVAGAAVLTALAVLNERATARHSGKGDAASATLLAQSFAHNSETIRAMGMTGDVTYAWRKEQVASLIRQDKAAAINAVFAGISRSARLTLQIAILGYGGFLVLKGEMTAGMIFASSLISGRGLQPIDQIVGGWKGLTDTGRALFRLRRTLEAAGERAAPTELPDPLGNVLFDQVVVAAPGNGRSAGAMLLKRVTFDIRAGECVAVIGASGAGKSTLARALVGAVELQGGTIRIDGADIRQWDRAALGSFIGYLSQEVDLLPGTVAQNIARFDPEASDAEIIAAARKAQVHELVLSLPEGYDTRIGFGGHHLSGGQRQRIALARAFFGEPRIRILDEPNANLDAEGDLALDRAVAGAKADGVTVLVVTQRRPIAEQADRILVLGDGVIQHFGDGAEFMSRAVTGAPTAPRAVA